MTEVERAEAEEPGVDELEKMRRLEKGVETMDGCDLNGENGDGRSKCWAKDVECVDA